MTVKLMLAFSPGNNLGEGLLEATDKFVIRLLCVVSKLGKENVSDRSRGMEVVDIFMRKDSPVTEHRGRNCWWVFRESSRAT